MTEKFKKLRMGTAVFMALLLFVMIPIQAMAQSLEDAPEENPAAQETVNNTPEPKILAEITKKEMHIPSIF